MSHAISSFLKASHRPEGSDLGFRVLLCMHITISGVSGTELYEKTWKKGDAQAHWPLGPSTLTRFLQTLPLANYLCASLRKDLCESPPVHEQVMNVGSSALAARYTPARCPLQPVVGAGSCHARDWQIGDSLALARVDTGRSTSMKQWRQRALERRLPCHYP